MVPKTAPSHFNGFHIVGDEARVDLAQYFHALRRHGCLSWTVLPARIGNAGDHPFFFHTHQIEQVGSAVIYLPIDQKIERRPHHRQIVIDPDQWIVNAFFNQCIPWFLYAIREGFKGHLRRLAIAHQHHRATRQRERPDRRGISL